MSLPTFVKMSLHAWDSHVARANKLFDSLSDDQMLQEVAPGRNRGAYLLGHLTAINDSMFSIMGIGAGKYHHLDEAFVKKPDDKGSVMPPVKELRENWADLNASLNKAFGRMSPEEWFSRHTLMTDEDFQQEPHRNKLSVLINRTNHMAYHLGQVALTGSRAD